MNSWDGIVRQCATDANLDEIHVPELRTHLTVQQYPCSVNDVRVSPTFKPAGRPFHLLDHDSRLEQYVIKQQI